MLHNRSPVSRPEMGNRIHRKKQQKMDTCPHSPGPFSSLVCCQVYSGFQRAFPSATSFLSLFYCQSLHFNSPCSQSIVMMSSINSRSLATSFPFLFSYSSRMPSTSSGSKRQPDILSFSSDSRSFILHPPSKKCPRPALMLRQFLFRRSPRSGMAHRTRTKQSA